MNEYKEVRDKFEKLICPSVGCNSCNYEKECTDLSQRLKELEWEGIYE